MTDTNPATSEQTPLVRRRLPDWVTAVDDDDDDQFDDQPGDDNDDQLDDVQDGNGGEGEHPGEQPPPGAAAPSLGEFLVEAWKDDSSGLRRACERLQPDSVRSRLRGCDLKDISRRSELPIGMLKRFVAGGALSDASQTLLTMTLDRPMPRTERLRALLANGRITADDVATIVGCRTQDVQAIASGQVGISRRAWRELECMVGSGQC